MRFYEIQYQSFAEGIVLDLRWKDLIQINIHEFFLHGNISDNVNAEIHWMHIIIITISIIYLLNEFIKFYLMVYKFVQHLKPFNMMAEKIYVDVKQL